MRKVVVTGATSMLGSALINRLIQDKGIKTIYAVIRPNSNKVNRIYNDKRIHFVECDIEGYSRLYTLIDDKCDVFFHMAWPRTLTYEENIADMILKCEAVEAVLEAVETAAKLGCKKFVGAGSQSEYGLPKNGMFTVHTECIPVRADGVFHLAAGQAARMAARSLGMKCIWMRIFSVYGVNDRMNSMINDTIRRLLNGEHCSFTKSEQQWDYVYSDDVAEAFYLVGKIVNEDKIYNIASGNSRVLKEYIEIIKEVVSPKAELGIGEREYPTDPIMNMEVDVSELKEDTMWYPKVDFRTGIKKIYESILNMEEKYE